MTADALPDDHLQVSLRTCLSLETVTLVITVSTEEFHLAPIRHRATWSNVLSVLSSIPGASPLRCLKLVLVAPSPPVVDELDVDVLRDSWRIFIDGIERFDKLAFLQVVVTLSTLPKDPPATRAYHPSVVAFFNTHAKENPPQGRRYALTVDFVRNKW